MANYIVNQGRDFDEEYRWGCIRAVKYNIKGNTDYHHALLKKLVPGDQIFHCVKGEIKAISIVKSPHTSFIWNRKEGEREAWKVECSYKLLQKPIELKALREDILRYRDTYHSPFNKNGHSQQGYLFELNDKLTSIFKRYA